MQKPTKAQLKLLDETGEFTQVEQIETTVSNGLRRSGKIGWSQYASMASLPFEQKEYKAGGVTVSQTSECAVLTSSGQWVITRTYMTAQKATETAKKAEQRKRSCCQ